LGNSRLTGISLTGIGLLLADGGQEEGAAQLLGAAASSLEVQSVPPLGRWPAQHEKVVVATQATLSSESFAHAWAEGEALSLEQATDLALAVLAELTSADAVDPVASTSGGATHHI
jgi:hypothetical protein